MAKRFRESKKWMGWYRDLPSKMKLFFDYMCDECDHAGIFKEDYKVASFCINEPFTREEVEQYLGSKMIRIDEDKLFIPSFVTFQYDVNPKPGGKKLNPENKAHLGVIRQLTRHGIDYNTLLPFVFTEDSLQAPTKPLEGPTKPLPRGPRVGEEVRVVVGIGERKRKGGVGEKQNNPEPDPDAPCAFCLNTGTVTAMRKSNGTQEDFACSCPLGAHSQCRAPWSVMSLVAYDIPRLSENPSDPREGIVGPSGG